MNNQKILEDSSQSSGVLSEMGDVVKDVLFQPSIFFLLVFCILGIIMTQLLGKNRREILASGYFSGRREKLAAIRTAKAQIQEKSLTKITLCIGVDEKEILSGTLKWKTLLTGEMSGLPLTDLQRSMITCGAPNTGKTFTIFDSLIRSTIRRGLPIIVFDPKGDQAKAHAALADACGYKVYFLAPGKPISDRLNILDFMNGQTDSSMAEQMAITINRNARVESSSKIDPFFGPSGDKLVRSILMLAKGTDYPDLVMAKRLLSLSDLTSRLNAAAKKGKLNPWVEDSFQQFLSGEASDKTIAGIQATASLIFDSFTRPEFMSTFIGPSTIPLHLTGKTILFIQPTRGKEDVVMPILATAIDLLVEYNFASQRVDPLLLSVDEFPMGYFPRLAQWVAFLRSSGFSAWLGFQNVAQVRKRYGPDDLQTIFGSCGIKAFFNPGDPETAKMIGEYLGDKQVNYEQSSNSSGRGGQSKSRSQQMQKVHLWSPNDVLRMRTGELVVINDAFASNQRGSVPLHIKVKIPQKEQKLQKKCEAIWESIYFPRLKELKAELVLDEKQLTEELRIRAEAAFKLLPTPEEEEASSKKATESEPQKNAPKEKYSEKDPQKDSEKNLYGILASEKEFFEEAV